MVGAGNSDRDGAEFGGARSSTRMLSAGESEENSLKNIQTGKIRGDGGHGSHSITFPSE